MRKLLSLGVSGASIPDALSVANIFFDEHGVREDDVVSVQTFDLKSPITARDGNRIIECTVGVVKFYWGKG